MGVSVRVFGIGVRIMREIKIPEELDATKFPSNGSYLSNFNI